jgi:N-acetylmuramoyl-L-alanine amidase
MAPPLNRRTALIAAGQGMAVLLLAACGKTTGQATGTPTSSATTTGAGRTSLATGGTSARVTVPGLEPVGTSAARTSSATSSMAGARIPLTPVTSRPTTGTTHGTHQGTAPGTTTPAHTSVSATSTPTTQPPTRVAASNNPVTSSSSSSSSTSARSSTRPVSGRGLAGKVVTIDPGHNGANGQHPEIINQLVDGGYGQRNACNTTGTQTDAGYPEHEFTWNVATYLRPLLEAKGITVVMTRSNDTGVGPCTDKRAAIENDAAADAAVSIHGDGAPPQVRGFYVLTATRPPAGAAMAAASLRLASCLATAAVAAGFPASNTLGSGGLWKRDDLTGLNRSTRPKILIECGNMRNATEAAIMSSTDGQQRYAQALAQGIFAFLQV